MSSKSCTSHHRGPPVPCYSPAGEKA